jgi:hypothetical protein
MYIVPATIKAAKAVTIRGVAYTKDQTLTAAQITAIPKLGALISKNVLYTTPDLYGRNESTTGGVRRGKRRPAPAFLAPRARKVVTSVPDFSIAASVDGTVTKKVTVTMSGGDGPFSVAWGDSSSSNVKGRTATHTYATAATFTITATGSNFDTATTTATTT